MLNEELGQPYPEQSIQVGEESSQTSAAGTDTPDPQLRPPPSPGHPRQMQLHTAPPGITKINVQPGHGVPQAVIIKEAWQNKSIDFVWAGGWELHALGKTSVSLPLPQSQGF